MRAEVWVEWQGRGEGEGKGEGVARDSFPS